MLPKNSPGPMPKSVPTPKNTGKHTSNKGPHGGGNQFHQLNFGNQFSVHDPITGHTQKRNVEDK